MEKKFQVIINGQLPFSFSEQLTRLKRTIHKMYQRISQLKIRGISNERHLQYKQCLRRLHESGGGVRNVFWRKVVLIFSSQILKFYQTGFIRFQVKIIFWWEKIIVCSKRTTNSSRSVGETQYSAANRIFEIWSSDVAKTFKTDEKRSLEN